MMCVLVWGFGDYYRKKESSIPKDAIAAFVSARETGQFQGIDMIKPQRIASYQDHRLYIMTGPMALFEILEELRAIGYEEWDNVVLGWNLEPYTEEESLLAADGVFQCDSKGILKYCSRDEEIELTNNEDWVRLKQRAVRNRRKHGLSDIPFQPISSVFGFDRGQPIDRYYIEKFLEKHSSFIKGTVLEVADRAYTVKYGKGVKESIVTRISGPCERDSMILNLETGEGVKEEIADCFILTQTLPFIFDVRTAANNVIRLLKKGGTALITVAGISQISRYDMDRWGHYWSFTTASLKRLFEEWEDAEYVKIETYGNVKSAAAGLYGLAVEEMKPEDLTYQDDDYQQIITAVVKKRGALENVHK